MVPIVDDGPLSALTLTVAVLNDFFLVGFVSSPIVAHGKKMSPSEFADHDIGHSLLAYFFACKPFLLEAFYGVLENTSDEMSRAQVIVGTFILVHENSYRNSFKEMLNPPFSYERSETPEYIALINDQFETPVLDDNATHEKVASWIKACFDHSFFSTFVASEKEYLAAQQKVQENGQQSA
jgi:hypothetical protein